MQPLHFLLLSVCALGAGAIITLLCVKRDFIAGIISSISGVISGVAGLAASIPVILTGNTPSFATAGPFPFTTFTVRMDMLAAFMVLVISVLTLATSVYAFSYLKEYEGQGVWILGFFMNLFVASMLVLVVVNNAFYFLVFFELMSLTSYFLVIFNRDNESIDAGYLYFLIAHAGSALIMGSFFIFWWETGSLDFSIFRTAELSSPLASIAFMLAFIGFGAKAGIVPLHSWLPRAHPAAPSHASAMMSGAMVKIGVFGIIRVGMDFLHASTTWWGLVTLAIGSISAVLGILYALDEQDIKRLLAYSTVENVGIILMGIGAGMIGMATEQPLLAIVGTLGALYHTLNHAIFKGLLFMGAGSIIFRTHTRNMAELGGLAKSMPYTGLAFLAGAMAISALPPLNGFVSEWYTYQALFSMGGNSQPLLLRIAGPLAMIMLALTGALALMCFIKLYGICFSGTPRSEQATHATEVPFSMTIATAFLALMCILLGIGASWISEAMTHIAFFLCGKASTIQVAQGSLLIAGKPSQSFLSMPLLTILLIALPLFPVLMGFLMKGSRLTRRKQGDPWACGYIHDKQMPVSSHGFVQPVRFILSPLFRLREILNPSRSLYQCLHSSTAVATSSEAVVDSCVVSPLVKGMQKLGSLAQFLQHGDIRMYCFYIAMALVVLLLIFV